MPGGSAVPCPPAQNSAALRCAGVSCLLRVDDGLGLRAVLVGVGRRERRRPELAARGHDPGLPRAGHRRDRACERSGRRLPGAVAARALAVPLEIGVVALGVFDDGVGDLTAEREARLRVAGVVQPGDDALARQPLRHVVQAGCGPLWIEVGQHARGGAGDDGMLGRIGRLAAGVGERLDVAGCRPAVAVLRLPGRHGRVVHRDAQQAVGARRGDRILGAVGHELEVLVHPRRDGRLLGGLLGCADHRRRARLLQPAQLRAVGALGRATLRRRRGNRDLIGRAQDPGLPAAGRRLGLERRVRLVVVATADRQEAQHQRRSCQHAPVGVQHRFSAPRSDPQ